MRMNDEINDEMVRRVAALGHLERAARMYARREAQGVLRRYVRGGLIAYLTLVLGIGYAVHEQRTTSASARRVVCEIIQRSDKQIYIYRDEGVINTTQLNRALKQSAEDRRLLNADCDTGITPPPANVKARTPEHAQKRP